MTTERDPSTRIVLSWLREDAHENAERVLLRALDEVDTTKQRRSWWPAWRFAHMNKLAQATIAAAAVLVVAVLGYNLLPRTGGVGGQPTPAPTTLQSPSPNPSPTDSSGPGTATMTPFGADGFVMCPPTEISSDCTEDPRDDSMSFTVEFPEGWEFTPEWGSLIMLAEEQNDPPGGAGLLITRGNWLYSDPCRPDDELSPDIEVGPTVQDFATALDTHPLLDVTTPVDVTLAGYSGKYLDIQVPADISGCDLYQPIEGSIYAQGPAHRWHYWILDVEDIRVVIQSYDYPGTSARHRAELQAIVDSIQITP